MSGRKPSERAETGLMSPDRGRHPAEPARPLQMFFQGPATGCTGNGVLTPHPVGEFFVFDVELVIENCNAAYEILNSRFTGLATATQNGYWSYDTWLAVFLSTPDEAESPVALTMYAQALPRGDSWDY